MKILHCISSLSGGGAERQLYYLSSGLAQKGNEIHIAYLTDGPNPPYYDIKEVTLHKITHKSNYDPMIILSLLRLINKVKPDIIHTWIIQMDILAGLLAKLFGIPWILREANSSVAAKHRGIKEQLRRISACFLNHAVANSKSGYNYWKKHSSNLNCSLIYNGLPEDVFYPIVGLPEKINSNRTLLFVGRLVPQKNIFLLLESFSRISKKHDVKLKIYGNGIQKKGILNFIKVHNLEDRVELFAHIEHEKLLSVMRESYLLINPSFYEGCPNVVMEAMASGCAVAVSSIDAHLDILCNNSAYFFNPYDVQSIENIISFALNEKFDVYEKVKIARDIAEMFKIKKMISLYSILYEKIISK